MRSLPVLTESLMLRIGLPGHSAKAGSTLPLLEETIVMNACNELATIKSILESGEEGNATAEDTADYMAHHHALVTLLVFGHQAKNGMSDDGIKALRGLESLYAVFLGNRPQRPHSAHDVSVARG